MRLHWKFLLPAAVSLLAIFGAGCSGINTTHSVSPATFLLPGFIQVQPQEPVPIAQAPPTEGRQRIARAQ